MQALADSLILTRSGVTRLVDRIEKAGLVRREPAAEDRRGYYAILTEAGEAKMSRAQRKHRQDIRQHYGEHLDDSELATVHRLMTKLIEGND